MLLSLILSMSITPLYVCIKSTKGAHGFANQLTYTKIISDSVGRPLAGFFVLFKTAKQLCGASLVRFLVAAPLFFLYITMQLPQADEAVFIFIILVSISSGYIITTGYRLATDAVPLDQKFEAASMISVAFNMAFFVAFGIDFAVDFLLGEKVGLSSHS
mmetsp:Transcript_43953/g.85979  ORF Transcript_43953/g.85979 Transcript_43953/m.85979 type:complete len:159 (+) Transcript_43953:1-477(+)